MSNACPETSKDNVLKTLPGDDVRQIMWRYSERYDLQMAVQSTRSVARGVVARLVANGARNTHEWTDEKAELLTAYDESGISSIFLDPEYGGFIEGPKNLALSLAGFELAWVDGGAATCTLATNLALEPINERGTEDQRAEYMKKCAPAFAAENGGKAWKGAFALTEPLPYVGVDTGLLQGRVRVASWEEDQEPMLQVEKRGRFITNMEFADFVTAAVLSDDEKLKGSCMVILEKGDEGTYDHGSPTLKLVHQLSATNDPIFNLKVPAHRIIGGYTIKDGVIIPNFTHSEVIEAVFRRTRVTPALMSSAKLLSAIEPVLRYQRQRFHGSEAQPGTPRYDLGLQQKEDALLRLADVWAAGEAGASLGFEASRLLDDFDPIEKEKDAYFAKEGLKGRRTLKVLKGAEKKALELVVQYRLPEAERDTAKVSELESDLLVRYVIQDSFANVVVPACKLWNTGFGTNMMREAISLMGGYGITEDCPGFLPQKWMDAQLEATYEGPECVQRRQMSLTMTNELFLAQFESWTTDLRKIAVERPGTGACLLASANELWLFTLRHLRGAKDSNGKTLYHGQRQGVTFPMADALSWLLASRSQILDVIELEEKGPQNATLAEGLDGYVSFLTDLSHVQAAKAAGEVGKTCAELVYGYNSHACWTKNDCQTEKAGPCVKQDEFKEFVEKRSKLDACLTGARLSKDRVAYALTQVMIPEALDYPA